MRSIKKFLKRVFPLPARTMDAQFYSMLSMHNEINEATNNIFIKLEDVNNRILKIEKRLKVLLDQKEYYYFKSLEPSKYECALEEWFERINGYKLNFSNPQTYNEKIQWLKLYDNLPIKTVLSDKYEVRPWIIEKIGEKYLIPLLGVWNHFDEIDFTALPEKFVLKCTHGSGWNTVVHDKKTMDIKTMRKKYINWINTNFAYICLELQYKNIPPRIIAEEYLENSDEGLFDYKVMCFNGEPEYIIYVSGRENEPRTAFFDVNWNLQPFIYISYRRTTDIIPAPEQLGEILSLARTLSQGFLHVRVDFYILNDGSIKFGEMTFTPLAGLAEWDPPEYDLVFGNKIILPTSK